MTSITDHMLKRTYFLLCLSIVKMNFLLQIPVLSITCYSGAIALQRSGFFAHRYPAISGYFRYFPAIPAIFLYISAEIADFGLAATRRYPPLTTLVHSYQQQCQLLSSYANAQLVSQFLSLLFSQQSVMVIELFSFSLQSIYKRIPCN